MAEGQRTVENASELTASGLFDAAWYLRCNEDVAAASVDPLEHFLSYGWKEERWPNRYFDLVWYRAANPDVAAADIDPLTHYIRHGDGEGRRPHPMFDPVWYRRAFGGPTERPALAHFLEHRLSGQVFPCPTLFAVPFLAEYRNDAAQGVDPFGRYLDDCAAAAAAEPFPEDAIVRACRLVDENYYLINGPDVHAAEIDPAAHFCHFGWRENRKPSLYFDPDWYRNTNPSVARQEINPLVHYILVGEAANRRPVPFFDPAWYRATYAVPDGQLALAHYLANRRTQRFSPTPLFDVQWYMDQAGRALGPNRDPFAHYLLAGVRRGVLPSPGSNTTAYQRTHVSRPSRPFSGMHAEPRSAPSGRASTRGGIHLPKRTPLT